MAQHKFLIMVILSAMVAVLGRVVRAQEPPQSDTSSTTGSLIAFTTLRDNSFEVFVMNPDGSKPTNVTNNPLFDRALSWSPDGNEINFLSVRFEHDSVMLPYTINLDGTNIRAIEFPDQDQSFAFSISDIKASPDGSLAFVISLPDEEEEIYVRRQGEVDLVKLTDNDVHDGAPDWSPDGNQIVFQTRRDGNPEIYVMNTDGSNPVNLTNTDTSEFTPVWSPDGTRIAFGSFRDGNAEIYVMNTDGSNPVNLTNHEAEDREPTWSPDGRHIAFHTDRDGNNEIYVMNADGSNPVNLTNNETDDADPIWSPALLDSPSAAESIANTRTS